MRQIESDLILTIPPELPPDMRAIWQFAVMHAQFKTLCLAHGIRLLRPAIVGYPAYR